MRRVNHGTVTGTLSWYKTLPLNGFNLIRAKQKLVRRRKRVHESFSSRQESRKSCTLTIQWNLANPVKFYHGTIEIQHFIDPRRMVLLKEVYRRVKEGTSAVLSLSGLDEKWWVDSLQCCCYLRNVQDLLADGKTPYGRRFGEPLKGPMIPSGALVEYHPISPEDQARIHLLGKKSIKRNLSWL